MVWAPEGLPAVFLDRLPCGGVAEPDVGRIHIPIDSRSSSGAKCFSKARLTLAVLFIVLSCVANALSQDQPGTITPVPPSLDSLQSYLLGLEVGKADAVAQRTDFWHRLVPKITFSASLGVSDIAFLHSFESPGYIIPKDAYRLTISLSLSEIISTADHEIALLERERRVAEQSALLLRRQNERERRTRRTAALREELSLLEEELRILQRIAAFNLILFEEGKIKFDSYVRSQLQIIAARQRIVRLRLELEDLTLN